MRAVTRDDVARYAGVSPSVVSYVVNGGPRQVAPSTAERVTNAISVLGYRPNASARALKTGSTAMLGLVVPGSRNPLFAELAHTIETEARRRGFALVLGNSAGEFQLELAQIQTLASHQLDGLMVASMTSDHAQILPRINGTPTVFLNQFRHSPGFTTIGPDAYHGSVLAVEHLIGHGHTSIAIVLGQEHDDSFRMDGWTDALRRARLDLGPRVIREFTQDGGYAAGREILGMPNRPSAIFASSDYQAVGLLRAMHEDNVRVPEEMAIISFDGTTDSEYTWPQLSVIRQPLQKMAALAVNAVINDMGFVGQHHSLEMELVLRRSCGCTAG